MMAGWWLLIGALVIAAVRALGRHGRPSVPAAEEILAERYARGEIAEAEYRTRLDVLKERR